MAQSLLFNGQTNFQMMDLTLQSLSPLSRACVMVSPGRQLNTTQPLARSAPRLALGWGKELGKKSKICGLR